MYLPLGISWQVKRVEALWVISSQVEVSVGAFEFSSVLLRCWLIDKKGIWPVETQLVLSPDVLFGVLPSVL